MGDIRYKHSNSQYAAKHSNTKRSDRPPTLLLWQINAEDKAYAFVQVRRIIPLTPTFH